MSKKKTSNNWIQFIISNIKDITITALIIFACIFGYNLWKDNSRLHENLIGTEDKYEQITEELAKLKTKYKSQEDLIKEKEKKFEEVIVEKDEMIRTLSETIFTHKNKVVKRKRSDHKYNKGSKSYVFNEIRIEGKDSPPIGWVMLHDNGTVRSGTYKFDIQVENLQTVDEKTGKVKVFSKGYIVAQQDGLANRKGSTLKKWKGVKYPLKVKGGVVLVDPTVANKNTKKKFYLWAPKFGMGLNVGADLHGTRINPSINFSTSGYGKSKDDLDFRFLEVGVGLHKNPRKANVNLKPVMWRPFKKFKNTYIGPGITYSPETGVGGTMGISVTF